MSKELMIMGLLMISVPIVVLTLGIGWMMNNDKREPDIDLDMRIYVPSRCRDRSSNNRSVKQLEEIKELAKKINVKLGEEDGDQAFDNNPVL